MRTETIFVDRPSRMQTMAGLTSDQVDRLVADSRPVLLSTAFDVGFKLSEPPWASSGSNAPSGAAPKATPTPGTGWITTGDVLLANTAAAPAREYGEAGRDALRREAWADACITSPAAAYVTDHTA